MHPHARYSAGDNSPLSAGTPRHRIGGAPGGSNSSKSGSGEGPGSYLGPSPLRERLRHVADTALADGITLPMHTTFEVVRADGEGEVEGAGMDFIVSVISGEALEAKVGMSANVLALAEEGWLSFGSRVEDVWSWCFCCCRGCCRFFSCCGVSCGRDRHSPSSFCNKSRRFRQLSIFLLFGTAVLLPHLSCVALIASVFVFSCSFSVVVLQGCHRNPTCIRGKRRSL